MKSVSPSFLAAVASSHNIALHVDAYYDGELIVADLPVTEGTVKLTRTDMVRAVLDCTIADPIGDLVPRRKADALNVYGQELHVRAGVEWPTREETVSLGWFRIQSFKADERWTLAPNEVDWIRSGANIVVSGMDRMAKVVDDRFVTQLQPVPGNSCLDEIIRLVSGIVPVGAIDADVYAADRTAPIGLVYEEDRAEAIAKLAASINAYCYIDGDGSLRVRSTTPIDSGLVIGAGTSGVAISIDTTNSRDGIYNAVVAKGEDGASVAPYQSVAYDRDPSSPTHWDGPFGHVPGFFSSPFITTQNAADTSARTRLINLKKEQEQQFSVSIVPNQAIEPDDIFTLVLPSQVGVKVKVVEATIPLGPQAAMDLVVVANRAALDAALGKVGEIWS